MRHSLVLVFAAIIPLACQGCSSSSSASSVPAASTRNGSIGGSIDFVGPDLVFVRVFQDSPAAHAGIKPNDRILRINGIPTNSMTIDGAKSLFRGLEGTSMQITVATANDPPRELTLTRQVLTSSVPLPGSKGLPIRGAAAGQAPKAAPVPAPAPATAVAAAPAAAPAAAH
jgi:membrane-associated protease RseP (regulator of RpoE activity)